MKFEGKTIEVRFADARLKEAFCELKDGKGEEKEVYKLVDKAIAKLMQNPFIGERVEKHLIPRCYIQKYGIGNLRKYNLNKSWRLIYTIIGEDLLIISVILEWMNHKQYERRFNY
jgi:hypothetical protein